MSQPAALATLESLNLNARKNKLKIRKKTKKDGQRYRLLRLRLNPVDHFNVVARRSPSHPIHTVPFDPRAAVCTGPFQDVEVAIFCSFSAYWVVPRTTIPPRPLQYFKMTILSGLRAGV